jgi:outer membrane protein
MMPVAVLLVTAAAWMPAAPDSGARPLTMAETVAMAERNAVAIIAAEGEQRASSAGVRTAWGAFLPSVSLSAGGTKQIPNPTNRTRVENGQVIILAPDPWSYSAGFGLNLDLFTGGQRFFDLQQAHARSSAADANQVVQRYAAVLAAQQQFFNVLAAREAQAVARAQLDQAEQQLKVSVLRLKARAVTRSDSLRSEIQVHNARLALVTATTALAVANASLTRAVGSDAPVTAGPDSTLDRPVLAVDDATLRQLALQGPAVKQAAASVDVARAATRTAWAAYLPTVSASYSRNGSGSGNDFSLSQNDLNTYSGALRLSLSLPLFTQFTREAQVTTADVNRDNAEAALRDARLAAIENLTQSLGSFHAAAERAETQAATVEAALEDLREQQDKYSIGAAVLLDVLTSQATLDQARHDLIQAHYDQRVARVQLEALVGRSL